MTPDEFVQDPRVKSLAPTLVEEMVTQGPESYGDVAQDSPTQFSSGLKLPLLKDIVQVISLNIFNGEDADWSRLEQAKLKATQEHGPEAMAAAVNLTEIDTRRAVLIVDTIYDTVINLPPPSKESYKTAKGSKGDESTEEKEGSDEETNQKTDSSSALWDFLGTGLIKSSNTVKKVKGMVNPSGVCGTTDTAYLEGVDDVVYYSSLTHGFAGGALVSEPTHSTIKSLDLQTIVSAIGKLAIEVHMAQNVARLAELNPAESPVRAMTYLALTSDSPTSTSAQMARDIYNLMKQNVAGDIPTSVLRSLTDKASLQLVTHGAHAGLGSGPAILNNIPIARDLFAFSTEVLNANSIGDVLKYVFCPEASSSESRTTTAEPPKPEEIVEEIKEGAEEAAEKGRETGQKVFRVAEDTVKKVTEEVKQKGQEAKGIKDEAAVKASEAGSNIKDKAEEIRAKVQGKVTEGTEKVNDAGEKWAQDAKDAATEGKKKAEEVIDAAKKKAKAGQEEAVKKAEEVKQMAAEKAGEVKRKAAEKADEAKQKAAEKVDEVKQEL
ncbi:hypothetical protein BGX34_003949 [Mortierella sp. NVP85]|nr:hypothetical protein BGX34_003949 [Mortierella sp. NVP85]